MDIAINELVQASHILAAQGIVDGFGHVSMRHPEDRTRFLIARSMAPALVTADDIMQLDLHGNPCDGDQRRPFLERFIHAAIYAAREDVGAVVHSHSPSVIPFGVVRSTPLRPVFHMAGFLGSDAPIFEIRDAGGEATDMLVRDEPLGQALAATLGEHSAVLMRGHGSTTIGAHVREAVFNAVYLETNARIQAAAMQLGEVTFLNRAEADNTAAAQRGQIDRAWDLWCRDISARL